MGSKEHLENQIHQLLNEMELRIRCRGCIEDLDSEFEEGNDEKS